jgi:hypothetical protein
MTVDRFWIGNWIYWTPTDPWVISNCNCLTNSHILQFTRTHWSLLSLLCLHQSSGNGFQRWTLPFPRVHELSRPQLQQLLTNWLTDSELRVRFTLRLVVYHQSVHLSAKPLNAHNQRFFFFYNWTLAVLVLMVHPLMRRWVCYLWIGLTFVKCMYCTHSIGLHGCG